MKIPKKIQVLLDRRERLADKLAETCSELDGWLSAQGMDTESYPLCDAISTGCMIYCEPLAAKQIVEEYIKEFNK